MPVNPEHPAEVRSDAYYQWAYTYGKNLTKTAEAVNIPLRTLQYWKAKDEWDLKYLGETTQIAGFALEYGWNELRLGVSSAALQLVKDASNPTLEHSERIQSQKLLFAIIQNASLSEGSGPSHVSLIDARQVHVTPHDMSHKERITASMEQNFHDALAEQTKSRRK